VQQTCQYESLSGILAVNRYDNFIYGNARENRQASFAAAEVRKRYTTDGACRVFLQCFAEHRSGCQWFDRILWRESRNHGKL